MIKIWESLWDSYLKIPSVEILNEPAGMTQRSEFVGMLLEHFDLKGMHILEVGTGTGQYSIELSLRGAHCTGIDINSGSIKLAQRLADDYNMTNCSFKNVDLFDFKGTKFDIVFSMGTIEHFTDKQIVKMLKKMSEIGDYVIVGVPYSGSRPYMLSKERSQRNGTWEYGEEQDFETLKDLFRQADLTLLQEKTIGVYSEAYYLNRVYPVLISGQVTTNLRKTFEGEEVGSWLVAIGSKHESLKLNIVKEGTSIIIPIYNGEKYIERLVLNLDKVFYPNKEIIFVNDCSTDNTKIELEKYYKNNGATILNLKKNVGEIEARLEGIKRAKYDYIYCLDADDLIFPGGIETMMRDLKSCPDNTYLSNSCALMKDGKFTGEIWFHEFLKNPQRYIVSELTDLCGKISLGNTIIKKNDLLHAYDTYHQILKKVNIERMEVAGDSLLLDIMVFNGYIEHIIPVYYTYRGYDHNIGTISQQADKRVKYIPLQMAYCFKQMDGNSHQKSGMADKAKEIYGEKLGKQFINNFNKYLEVLNAIN